MELCTTWLGVLATPFMRGARGWWLLRGRAVLALGFVVGVERTGRCAEWEVPRGRGDITGVDILRGTEGDVNVDVAEEPLMAVQGRRVLGYRIMKYGPPWRWCDWRGHAVRATGGPASTRQEADGRPANCRCYDVTAAMTNSSEDAQPQHAEQRTALAERC